MAGDARQQRPAADGSHGLRTQPHQLGAAAHATPITYLGKDGKQYVTVTSGIGGVYALKMGDPNVAKVPAGGSLWTFKLFEE